MTEPDAGGYLVIRRPWPSMLRTIWGDNKRYLKTYWEKFQNRFYVAGDGAHRDADGYFWIMGRIDDVLKVSGHRLGTMEVESALVAHPRVAEAAVVGRPHDIKGESIFAYVVVAVSGRRARCREARRRELREWVGKQLGAIAKPDDIRFTEVLPKTRSGKIMRRLLRALARGEEITQDISTLENPAIIAQLRGDAGDGQRSRPRAGQAKKAPRAGKRAANRPQSRHGPKPSARPWHARLQARRGAERSARAARRTPAPPTIRRLHRHVGEWRPWAIPAPCGVRAAGMNSTSPGASE